MYSLETEGVLSAIPASEGLDEVFEQEMAVVASLLLNTGIAIRCNSCDRTTQSWIKTCVDDLYMIGLNDDIVGKCTNIFCSAGIHVDRSCFFDDIRPDYHGAMLAFRLCHDCFRNFLAVYGAYATVSEIEGGDLRLDDFGWMILGYLEDVISGVDRCLEGR